MGLRTQHHTPERRSTLDAAVLRLTPSVVATANGMEVVAVADNRGEVGGTEKVAEAQRTTSP